RTDEANRILAAGVVDRLQLYRRGLRGLFPRHGIKLAALTNQRLTDALGVLREVKSKPPLHAQKILVDPAQVPVVRTQNLVIAHAQRSLAAIRAVRAHRRD